LYPADKALYRYAASCGDFAPDSSFERGLVCGRHRVQALGGAGECGGGQDVRVVCQFAARVRGGGQHDFAQRVQVAGGDVLGASLACVLIQQAGGLRCVVGQRLGGGYSGV
jgi:hypothetical protein